MRLTLRSRITILFAVAIAVVIGAVGTFVYVRTGADLLDTVDAGLRSRADIIVSDVTAGIPTAGDARARLIEADEAFAQVLSPLGAILESSAKVSGTPLLAPQVIAGLRGPRIVEESVPGIDNVTRVLAVPVQTSNGIKVAVVGASLQDRRDAMLRLAATLALGGAVALLLLSWAGWLVVGAALRPVERLRAEAAAISASERGRRLRVPPTGDELARLATTFNAVLERLQAAADQQQRLVDDASHELRTPLSVLKAELDLALARSRTPRELEDALRRASSETDRLARLADDLLVLSRADAGRVPIRRRDVSLDRVMAEASGAFESRARRRGITLETEAPSGSVHLDPDRLRQAVDNLLDNSLRYASPGSSVNMWAGRADGTVSVVVSDRGPGFSQDVLDRAFEPFVRGRTATDDEAGAGLGLAIVRAVAEGHGGRATAENLPGGGACVTLSFPA